MSLTLGSAMSFSALQRDIMLGDGRGCDAIHLEFPGVSIRMQDRLLRRTQLTQLIKRTPFVARLLLWVNSLVASCYLT
jgi:hypothetical protein